MQALVYHKWLRVQIVVINEGNMRIRHTDSRTITKDCAFYAPCALRVSVCDQTCPQPMNAPELGVRSQIGAGLCMGDGTIVAHTCHARGRA
jgi:hypothetical protein